MKIMQEVPAMNTPHVPMDEARLLKYAANAARSLKPSGAVPCRALASRLRENLEAVQGAAARLTDWAAGQKAVPGAVEWLLDNHYLAARAGEEARRTLKSGRPLRGDGAGEPLLWACARSALWAVPGLDTARLALFLQGFQSVLPLTERELSLLVSALAGVVVERLSALCGDPSALQKGRVAPEEMAKIFTALRALEGAGWSRLLEEASQVEGILAQDPTGHYPGMDGDTRRRYRQRLCRLARKGRMDEGAAARLALELARKEGRHIGWYLYREPLGQPEKLPSGRGYAGAVAGLSLLAALALWGAAGTPVAALLLVLPLSDLVKNILDFTLVHLVPPRPVPRMELSGGIPKEGRTLCVVVSLLTGEDSGPQLAALLERYRLANRDAGPELRLGILADLPDSAGPMDSEGAAWVEGARQAVEALNEKHGGGFYLFFRPPALNPRDGRYMGHERKRGALTELARLLRRAPSGLEVTGDRPWLDQVQYVITLDGDTALNVGSARALAGAMLHPLNAPVIDPARRVVVSGHALLQPRVAVELEAANKSFFSRVYGGLGGVDPYGSTASDVYHDLCDQGTYTGKGIFSVDAFLACLDGRFPDNAILSHDLLEGSYLRAGLLGEVELTDGCPYKVHGYFARLHRWIRGDWQLLPWLGRRVPNGEGGREGNPLPPLAKWKIFDNLRRSLSPVFTLLTLVLGICFSGKVFAIAGGVAVLSAASNLLLSGAELAVRRNGGHRRYHSTIIAGLAGTVLQTALQLILLPWQAYVSLTAASSALWRMAVSHRNLLAWVTAAQAERRGSTLWFYFRQGWFSAAIGLLVLFAAQLRIGRAAGLLWLMAPALAWLISRPARPGKKIPPAGRAFLLRQGELIWGYFAQFLREEDHYLPPDNWQEQPGPALARRTSPTNIGMALLSTMAAADLELLPQEKAVDLISHTLDTVERLEKWRGHLYNWYDTATLAPLHPRYVSTVDSGNLRGCLIALREGLYRWGEAGLARRAEALSGAMDCAPLYDRERKLFSIGYEVERGELTNGYYDLMASEARQTSYICVAKGEVPPRHWRRLGRMLLGDNDYSGMASWTGTMFEYFMPHLLLPAEPNSFLYETLAFCVYAQKRRGSQAHAPWGISESAFYSFDPGMNYQYKAHGVQSLGLKRGLDSELVISPYSSFLALLLAPKSALANLRRLRDMGLEGKYGLYEAVDRTPSRLQGGAPYEVIRSYMSHHLGMSLVAIDNALRDNIMQKRFMRDCDMAAYRELLQERVPVGAPILRRPEREVPEKPRPAPGPELRRSGEGAGLLAPACHLLSNGSWHVLACDNGLTASRQGDWAITLARPGAYCQPAGVSVFFSGPKGTVGLTPSPLFQDGDCRWEFHSSGALWQTAQREWSARLELSVPGRESGELRQITLFSRENQPLKGEIWLYLEPVLCPMPDYDAHPAFSRLFVEHAQFDGGAVFHRRPRGGEPDLYLAVCWTGGTAALGLDRSALGRGGLRALPGKKPGLPEGEGGSDPCLLAAVPVDLAPGERVSISLALAAGESLQAARESARRILAGRGGPPASLAPLLQKLELTEAQGFSAFQLLSRLAAVEEKTGLPPREGSLWPLGISGDLPIAVGQLSSEEDQERAALWCRQHQFLTRSGFPFDLVLLVEEGGDYRRPLRSALMEALRGLGAESALGARGGIHLVESAAAGQVLPWAKAVLPAPREAGERERFAPPSPVNLKPGPAPWETREDGSVVISAGDRLPPVGWSQVLCNENFGWITDETGDGFLWDGGNSREHRLSPWANDPLAVGGPEKIVVSLNGREYSIFADGDGHPCSVTYRPGLAQWEKRIGPVLLTTQGFVPWDRDCRVLRVTLSGGSGVLSCRLDGREEAARPIGDGQTLALVTQGQGGRPVYHFEEGEFLPEQEETVERWEEKVSSLKVFTPDEGLNRYLNSWCLYQVIACRLMARTSQYQNGGAFGFRDQLQDVLALVYTWPARAREQLLLAASRQFEEGDVQHWWHPPEGAGVRTRISDDLLWLPWVLCRYCQTTGDWGILEEQVPYLTSKPLGPEEGDRYETPQASQKVESLYSHALAAIRHALGRGTGAHGLALMGTGDWNDGMNRVGEKGRGESVWLTWFLAAVLQAFSPVCERMGDREAARECLERADQLMEAAQKSWDGGWYRRGYYDDGAPLGSAQSQACQLDSIAQSFSVFPRGTDRERANQAVSAALERLFDRENGVVRLFDPAFDGGEEEPGYIKAYPAGVRENGGQYTHGAVWLAIACFRLNRPREGWAVLQALLPQGHPTKAYRGEPYVLAGDVSREGRAGWTWYTGAAGWYWQAAVEELLGITVKENKLTVEPNLPPDWPGYRAEWKLPKGRLAISVERVGRYSAALDGRRLEGGVPLELEGEHTLRVTV